jgi:hypothetical protein
MLAPMKRVTLVGAALALLVGAGARAADTKAVVAEIETHDKAFLAAYEKGDTKRMKGEIGKAVSLGEKNKLAAEPVMADTYVLAAILEVDGNENMKAGVRDFVKALKIKPDVAIPKGMATSPVKAAIKEARLELGLLPKESAVAAAPAEAAKAKETATPEPVPAPKTEATKTEAAKTETAKAAEEPASKQLAGELANKDKQLADARSRIQQLEKDKADRDKQLADKDKQLADARSRVQQLEKDKADHDKQATAELANKDKQLADARTQSSKDREALEKVTRDKQAAEATALAAENRKKQEREERERQFAGPAMPAHLTEALTCAIPDEAPLRTDLYVHCVARPNMKARTIVFYYRTGSAHYLSVPMERTAKGWYAAVVPADRVTGKVLQYYAEAFDGREAVVAHNGKENSPNILTLRPGGPRG